MINRHLIVLAILASACGKAPGIAGPLDAATATTDSPEAMFPHAITSFGFRTQDNQDLRSDVDATITAMTINVTVPLVDITALKPRFTFDGSSVVVGMAPQTSEVTAQDFSAPITYTVNATDGSSADYTVVISVASFSSTVDGPTLGAGTIAIGDINRDGKPDLVSANRLGTEIFLNTMVVGAMVPSFADGVSFTGGNLGISPAIVDVNGDGNPDVIVADHDFGIISILLNTTPIGGDDPSFLAPFDLTTSSDLFSFSVGDLNGDGKPDIIAVENNAFEFSVFLNTTTAGSMSPTFAKAVDFATGNYPGWASIADLNADGKPDIVVGDGAVSVFLNTTAIGAAIPSFAARSDFTPSGIQPAMNAVGDLDGDGKPDLVSADNNNKTVSVFANATPSNSLTANFVMKLELMIDTNSGSVVISDLNGDGRPDVVVANPGLFNSGSNTVSLFLNETPPHAPLVFSSRIDFITGVGPTFIATGDLNRDGKPDLAISDTGISILLAN